MKMIAAVMISLFAVSAFASNVADRVREVEFERNAVCTEAKQSLRFCLGGPSILQTCHYSIRFECLSNEGNFGLKLKIRERYNGRLERREALVTRVTITEK
jgi:hypothetical protein